MENILNYCVTYKLKLKTYRYSEKTNAPLVLSSYPFCSCILSLYLLFSGCSSCKSNLHLAFCASRTLILCQHIYPSKKIGPYPHLDSTCHELISKFIPLINGSYICRFQQLFVVPKKPVWIVDSKIFNLFSFFLPSS